MPKGLRADAASRDTDSRNRDRHDPPVGRLAGGPSPESLPGGRAPRESGGLFRRVWARGGGVVTLSVGPLFSQALTAVAALIVARRGGDAQFGRLAVLLGVTALACDLADFGTSGFVSREVSSHRISPRVGALWALRKSVVALAAAAVLVIVTWQLHDGLWMACAMGGYVTGFCLRSGLLGVCRAAGHYLTSSIAPTVERSILVVVVVLFAAAGLNVVLGFVTGLAIGALAAAGVGLAVLLRADRRPVGWAGDFPMSLVSLYRHSRHLGLSGMASDLNVLEVPAITIGSGLAVAGNYSAASRLTGPLEIPVNAVATIITREVSAARDSPHPIERALRSYCWVPVCYLVGCGLIALASSPIIRFLYGPAFGPATAHALALAAAVTAIRSMNDMIYAALVGVRAERVAARWLWATIPLGVVLAGVGADFGGAVLATVGGGVAQLVLLFGQARAVIVRRAGGRRLGPLLQTRVRVLLTHPR